MTETWRPVPNFEGLYEVSDHGNVRSLDRRVPMGLSRRFHKGVMLKPVRMNETGHLKVSLSKESLSSSCSIHRLVLSAFVGPCPHGLQGCHNNGIPSDNRVENLRWDTPASNTQDSVRHGTHVEARKTHCPQGHEYTPENTDRYGPGRMCSTCRREHNRRAYYREREVRIAAGEFGRKPVTHCPKGHPYEGDNLGFTSGYKRCLKCHRDRERQREAAKRAAAQPTPK